MTDDEVNRRIAEFVGYKVAKKSFGNRTGYRLELNGTAVVSGGGAYGWGWCVSENCWNSAPKFTASLDACQSVIVKLSNEQFFAFIQNRISLALSLIDLSKISGDDAFTVIELKQMESGTTSRALVLTLEGEK